MRIHTLAPLGDLVESVQTWSPEREPADAMFTYVDLSSVDQVSKTIVEERVVPCVEAPSRARQIVKAGDVLVSTVRPNLNAVALVPARLDGATASTGFTVLRPRTSRLDRNYLFHWVKSPRFVDAMVRRATGASYPAVSDRIIAESQVPLPPLPEQRRVAEILDKADSLRDKRRAALTQLDSLTQSIFLDMFGDSPTSAVTVDRQSKGHPRGWDWRMLTDVAQLATGHTPDRERDDYWNGDIPWISLTDIRDLDGRVAYSTLQNVTDRGIANSSAVRLPAGTVCFSRTASIGFVTVMGREMATSQDFVNWIPGSLLDPTYLMWALIRSRPQLRGVSSGSTHKTIYVRVVEQFRALLPPIELQRTFAQRIATLGRWKALHRAALEKTDSLFVSLQHQAFGGEL